LGDKGFSVFPFTKIQDLMCFCSKKGLSEEVNARLQLLMQQVQGLWI